MKKANQLEQLFGRKIIETEMLKAALEIVRSTKLISRILLAPPDDYLAILDDLNKVFKFERADTVMLIFEEKSLNIKNAICAAKAGRYVTASKM